MRLHDLSYKHPKETNKQKQGESKFSKPAFFHLHKQPFLENRINALVLDISLVLESCS